MKSTIRVISFFLVAAVATACTPTDEKSTVALKERERTTAQLDSATSRTKDAAQEMNDYTYERKAEFLAKMKTDLAEIQKELDRLDARIDASSGAQKAEAKAQLEAVRAKWAQAKKQLDEAERANESTWNSVKDGFRNAYGDLKDSFEKTRQWLSDKIEP